MINSYQKFHKLSGFLLFAITLLTFSSCKDNSAEVTNLGSSHLLLVNSAASSAAINLYSTGAKVNTVPLTYGSTTGYQPLASGIRDVQIKVNATNQLLATNTINIVRDSSYTFFVYEANKSTATVMAEDDLSLPSAGNAKVKFANLSSGLSAADLIISNGPALASSVSFGAISSYIELKAATYNLTLLVHGSKSVVLNIPNMVLENGKIYTIWSSGMVNGTGTAAVAIQKIAL